MSRYTGWIEDKNQVFKVMKDLESPIFGDVWEPIRGSGKGKVVLLYHYVREVSGGFPIRNQSIGDCQPKDSLVIGPDKVRKIQDVKIGDRVYCGNGDITTVISTMCKKSHNPILTIHTKGGLPLKVTSDHKVLAYKFGEFVSGNEKSRRRYSPGYQKTCINARGEDTKLKGNVVFESRTAELVPASDLTEADYLLCPVNIEIDTKIPEEMLPYMGSEDLRWMIGLFLGDGCVPKSTKSQITWGCTTDEPEIEMRLWNALDSINQYWSSTHHCKTKSQKAKIVRISNTDMARLFYKHFYDSDGLKILPSWAINDDVIEGLLDADGYINKANRTVLENTSPSLVYGTRIWALRNGFIPALNKRTRFDKRTGKTNKTVYSVQWSNDKTSRNLWRDDLYLAMPITKIEISEGPHEEVYDIGVAHRDHTFLSEAGSAISNCVSMAAAYATDCIKAVDIKVNGDFEEWVAETATEDLYAGSRVNIGGGRFSSDGSIGAWVAKYLNQYGALPRKKFGSIDLSTYSGSRARQWGAPGRGVPRELIPFAKEHPIHTVSRVDTYTQCRDLIANGYAVIICSNQGFVSKRDKDGFASTRGSWAHAMCAVGVDDNNRRPGVCIQNSWGVWNSGPKQHNQPDGSFWVDANVLEDRMLSRGDSWAISGYEGFRPQKLNTRII